MNRLSIVRCLIKKSTDRLGEGSRGLVVDELKGDLIFRQERHLLTKLKMYRSHEISHLDFAENGRPATKF
jgi:hypothetical protein